MKSRVAFTIAVGKPIYFTMACALARSFSVWNRDAGIDFAIVTDRSVDERPSDLKEVHWIEVEKGQYGHGFTPKLYLDKLAPGERSLFIDADCLCVGSLAKAFDTFKGKAVTVIGRRISNGEWFGNVEEILARTGVESIPRFNGGVYYLEPGEECTKVFETARELQPRYDEIGFLRLRGAENDEVLIAVAMGKYEHDPVKDDGTIMNTLLAAPGGLEIDVLSGKAILYNPKKSPNHNSWYDLEEMRPALVHFLGGDVVDHPYRSQILLLQLTCGRRWPALLARIWVFMRSEAPWFATRTLKSVLRSPYHALFGARSVKQTARCGG